MRAVLPALLTVALLSGCGMPTASDWRRCSFNVSEVAFQGLRENQAEWRVVVNAINPGGKKLTVDGLHLFALMQGDTLARLTDPGRVTLGAMDTTQLTFDVSMPHAAWSKALKNIGRSGTGEVLITGDVRVPTVFGSRLIKNAIKEKHVIDLSSLMGGMGLDLFRGLFGR